MIVFALGCGLIGFCAGAILAALAVSYTINTRWRMNAMDPEFLKYDGRFYKVITRDIPKSWEYAHIKLKKKSRYEGV